MLTSENYRSRLDLLVANATQLVSKSVDIAKVSTDDSTDILDPDFTSAYQEWYSEAYLVVKQVLPHRLEEFAGLYERDPQRKTTNVETFTIRDWFDGIVVKSIYSSQPLFNHRQTAARRFIAQLDIFRAAVHLFDGSLSNMRALAQADLFDAEIDIARELLENGFLRAGGAVAGVVLEKHLAEVAFNHDLVVGKMDPSINDYNETLKASGVADLPTWRRIQLLGDVRNLCVHNKQQEPTVDQVTDLIVGVESVTKTLF